MYIKNIVKDISNLRRNHSRIICKNKHKHEEIALFKLLILTRSQEMQKLKQYQEFLTFISFLTSYNSLKLKYSYLRDCI